MARTGGDVTDRPVGGTGDTAYTVANERCRRWRVLGPSTGTDDMGAAAGWGGAGACERVLGRRHKKETRHRRAGSLFLAPAAGAFMRAVWEQADSYVRTMR